MHRLGLYLEDKAMEGQLVLKKLESTWIEKSIYRQQIIDVFEIRA